MYFAGLSALLSLAAASQQATINAKPFDFKTFAAATFDVVDQRDGFTSTSLKVNLTDTELAQVAVADGSDHVPIGFWKLDFKDDSNCTGTLLEAITDNDDEYSSNDDLPWKEVCNFQWVQSAADVAVSTIKFNGVTCHGVAAATTDAKRAYLTITVVNEEGDAVRNLIAVRRPLPATKTFWQSYGMYVAMGGMMIFQIGVKWFANTSRGRNLAMAGRNAAAAREEEDAKAQDSEDEAAESNAAESKKDK